MRAWWRAWGLPHSVAAKGEMDMHASANRVGALTGAIQHIEEFLFRMRKPVLAVLVLLTLALGWSALKLRMEAGFEKQMPTGHEYIKTFQAYRNDVLGANRLNFVVKAKSGTIWTSEGLTRLYEVTQAVTFLPNVERLGVQSLWTPNAFVNEITEEGFRADPIIDGSIVPESLNADMIDKIARATSQGGYRRHAGVTRPDQRNGHRRTERSRH